jgi:hypothetical protein
VSPEFILSCLFPLIPCWLHPLWGPSTAWNQKEPHKVSFILTVLSAFPSSSLFCIYQSSLRLISLAFRIKSPYTVLEGSCNSPFIYLSS